MTERDKDIVKPYSLYNYLQHFSKGILFHTRPEIFKDDIIGMTGMRKNYSERFHPMVLPDSRTMLSQTSVRLIVSSWENYCVGKIQQYKIYADEYPSEWDGLNPPIHRGVHFERTDRIKEVFDLVGVEVFDDDKHAKLFQKVMQIRHVIVHDWGMITKENYEGLGYSQEKIDNPIILTPQQLENCIGVIRYAVKNIELAMNKMLDVKLVVFFDGGDVDWNAVDIL